VNSQRVRKPIISFTLSLDVVDLIERLCGRLFYVVRFTFYVLLFKF
jgi:hypothetical protein